MARHGIEMRVAPERRRGDVERRQLRPAEGAFRHERGRHRQDALERAVRGEARDARVPPVADPDMPLGVDGEPVRMAPARLEMHESPRLAGNAVLEIMGIDDAAWRIDGVEGAAVVAHGRAVRHREALVEGAELTSVPAPEGAAVPALLLVHGAEIEAAVRPDMTVV